MAFPTGHITMRAQPRTPVEDLRPDPADARLREAHHRIANNLALLAGFVRLRSSQLGRAPRPVSAEEARSQLEEVGIRIQAVAQVHRLLSLNAGHTRIDLGDYLTATCEALCDSLSIEGRMELICDVSACDVEADQAQLIGLIVTELVTNAVKYAHPTGIAGRVCVGCQPMADGGLHLSVADDGVGFPEGFEPLRDGGLGLRVIRSLAAQLAAEVEFDAEDGVGLTVHVAVPPRSGLAGARVNGHA